MQMSWRGNLFLSSSALMKNLLEIHCSSATLRQQHLHKANIMKKILQAAAAIITVIIMTLGIFILWGSSSTISEEEFLKGSTSKGPGTEAASKKIWSLMTYNVGFASGMANSLPYQPGKKYFEKNMATIQAMLKKEKPDFLTVQEIDRDSNRSFHINQVTAIAKKQKYHAVAYAPNFTKNYVPFPYWPPSAHWGKVNSGQALFSSLPVTGQKITHLDPPEDYSLVYRAFYIGRAIQKIEVNLKGRKIFIFNVHLEAWDGPTREKQAAILLDHYRKVKNHPVIIAGDFNVTPSYATRKHNFPDDSYGVVDYRGEKTIDIILQEKSLKTAVSREEYLKNEKKYMTYTSANPHMRIDFIFYNTLIQKVESRVIAEYVSASDHRPLLMRFRIKK